MVSTPIVSRSRWCRALAEILAVSQFESCLCHSGLRHRSLKQVNVAREPEGTSIAPDQHYSAGDLAKRWHLSPNTMRRLVADDVVPPFELGFWGPTAFTSAMAPCGGGPYCGGSGKVAKRTCWSRGDVPPRSRRHDPRRRREPARSGSVPENGQSRRPDDARPCSRQRQANPRSWELQCVAIEA